jgi:hypothetical protein
MTGFPADVAAALEASQLVVIETSAAPDAPVHETIIWVVVDDRGRALVRSVRGPRGRWYRELRANPTGTLVVGDRRVPVRAEPGGQPEIDACTEALRAKYPRQRASLASMLAEHTLSTTLVLTPA